MDQVPSIRVNEWEEVFIPDLSFSAFDYKLAKQLTGGEGRVTVEELRSGIRIKAYSWVGVVKFSKFELQVVPKLADEYLGLLGMLSYTRGVEAFRRNIGERNLEVYSNGHLLDLFALLLAEECDVILKQGLLFDYIEEEDDLPVMRGRILVSEQFRRHYGRVDKLACRFDQQSSNIIENQILSAALAICSRRVSDPKIKRRVRNLSAIFSEVCTFTKLDIESAEEELNYNRLNEHYKYAHELAWIILKGLGVEDLFATGRTRSFAFLLDMNKIFELFVVNFVNFSLRDTEFQVISQRRIPSVIWDIKSNRSYKRIIPDILIKTGSFEDRVIAIDAKYKDYDFKKVANSDIYQAFLYAYGNSREDDPLNACIVYPSRLIGDSVSHLQVRDINKVPGANLIIQGLHIVAAIEELRSNKVGEMGELIRGLVRNSYGSRVS